jgi:hypothetical protein
MEERGFKFLLEVQGSVAAVAGVVRGMVGEPLFDSISGHPRLVLFFGMEQGRGFG